MHKQPTYRLSSDGHLRPLPLSRKARLYRYALESIPAADTEIGFALRIFAGTICCGALLLALALFIGYEWVTGLAFQEVFGDWGILLSIALSVISLPPVIVCGFKLITELRNS